MRASFAVLAAAAVAGGATGCGGDSAAGNRTSSSTARTGLTVYAAASLREVLPSIDPAPRYSFAGSDELATQIAEGAPADVYAAASAKYPRQLFADGLVEQPVTFASNRLVLLVPKGNPAGIATVRDVSGKGVKLVVAGEGVPVGDYTRQVLENLGLTGALGNVVSNEKDVKGVVGKVSLGEADAGFAYATDAVPVGDTVRVIDIPAAAQPPIEYRIAVVASSRNKDGARAFIGTVTGESGRSALRAAGFVVP